MGKLRLREAGEQQSWDSKPGQTQNAPTFPSSALLAPLPGTLAGDADVHTASATGVEGRARHSPALNEVAVCCEEGRKKKKVWKES